MNEMIGRRDVLKSLFYLKDRVDYLEARQFFRRLLEVYKELEELEGFGEWCGIYRDLESGNCTSCDERKLGLLGDLIFAFGESKVLNVIERVADLHECLKEEV